jgi:hypothetical protein
LRPEGCVRTVDRVGASLAGKQAWPVRRTLAAGVSLFLIVASLLAATRLNDLLQLDPGPHEFSVAAWVTRNFPSKWLFLSGQAIRGRPPQPLQDATIQRFFELTGDIDDIERSLNEARQRGLPPDEDSTAMLAALRKERDRIENQVEATLEARVSAAAERVGLTRTLIDIVWPPVDFEFTDSPRTLVTSRRDRIQVLETDLLRVGLAPSEIDAIEDETASRNNVSALAFPTSGVGAYPTLVGFSADYPSALETIAHEWVHNYLFFYPLGFNYYDSDDLRALNETVANIVGRELAAVVMQVWPLQTNGEDAPPQDEVARDMDLDIDAELRSLRGEVDAILAEGRVADAERLMEERRRQFAEGGYYIRKLNQAYFAFTNLYAGETGSPSATNPIGPKIDELRGRSVSLRDFVEKVSGVTSVEELDRLLR